MKYVIEIYHRNLGTHRHEYDTRYDAALALDSFRKRFHQVDGWEMECIMEVTRRYTDLHPVDSSRTSAEVFQQLFEMHLSYSEGRK